MELARADSLMEVRPDSAMAYLASLDSFVQGEPEYVRMYYALQQIKAQDKCYIPHTSDSVILSLVRYYTDYGTPDQQMEAYHYLGSVYRDMGGCAEGGGGLSEGGGYWEGEREQAQ